MGVERKSNGTYQARYFKDGKRINVGTFKSKSEARRHLAMARSSILQNIKINTDGIVSPRKIVQITHHWNNGGYTPIKPILKQRFITWLKSLRAN